MMRLILNIILSCFLIFFNCCTRRTVEDLIDHNVEYTKVEIDCKWNNYSSFNIDEATLLIYENRDNNKKTLYKTLVFETGKRLLLNLPTGVFSFILINDKLGDFSNCRIVNQEEFDEAGFSLSKRVVNGVIFSEYDFYLCPDNLVAGIFSDFTVTKEMTDKTQKELSEGKPVIPTDTININAERVTRNVSFDFNVSNSSGMKKAEVVFTGGYNKILLGSLQTTTESGSRYINSMKVDKTENTDNAVVSGAFNSYGASLVNGFKPNNQAIETPVFMTLFITLKDKKRTVIKNEFEVTDLYNIEGISNHDIHIKLNEMIDLPIIDEGDIEGENSNSGLIPDVDDWGNDEIINVNSI